MSNTVSTHMRYSRQKLLKKRNKYFSIIKVERLVKETLSRTTTFFAAMFIEMVTALKLVLRSVRQVALQSIASLQLFTSLPIYMFYIATVSIQPYYTVAHRRDDSCRKTGI